MFGNGNGPEHIPFLSTLEEKIGSARPLCARAFATLPLIFPGAKPYILT
jgi:hypothetical protein